MTLDTLLDPPAGTSLLRPAASRMAALAAAVPAPSAATEKRRKRARASELLKTLLGIHNRQKAEMTERVAIRMSVFTPGGGPAVSLWVNGKDSLR
ncbi:MAG: hypothetical protein ACRCXM_00210 [Beijerinckiaceae bacterium]